MSFFEIKITNAALFSLLEIKFELFSKVNLEKTIFHKKYFIFMDFIELICSSGTYNIFVHFYHKTQRSISKCSDSRFFLSFSPIYYSSSWLLFPIQTVVLISVPTVITTLITRRRSQGTGEYYVTFPLAKSMTLAATCSVMSDLKFTSKKCLTYGRVAPQQTK